VNLSFNNYVRRFVATNDVKTTASRWVKSWSRLLHQGQPLSVGRRKNII